MIVVPVRFRSNCHVARDRTRVDGIYRRLDREVVVTRGAILLRLGDCGSRLPSVEVRRGGGHPRGVGEGVFDLPQATVHAMSSVPTTPLLSLLLSQSFRHDKVVSLRVDNVVQGTRATPGGNVRSAQSLPSTHLGRLIGGIGSGRRGDVECGVDNSSVFHRSFAGLHDRDRLSRSGGV